MNGNQVFIPIDTYIENFSGEMNQDCSAWSLTWKWKNCVDVVKMYLLGSGANIDEIIDGSVNVPPHKVITKSAFSANGGRCFIGAGEVAALSNPFSVLLIPCVRRGEQSIPICQNDGKNTIELYRRLGTVRYTVGKKLVSINSTVKIPSGALVYRIGSILYPLPDVLPGDNSFELPKQVLLYLNLEFVESSDRKAYILKRE